MLYFSKPAQRQGTRPQCRCWVCYPLLCLKLVQNPVVASVVLCQFFMFGIWILDLGFTEEIWILPWYYLTDFLSTINPGQRIIFYSSVVLTYISCNICSMYICIYIYIIPTTYTYTFTFIYWPYYLQCTIWGIQHAVECDQIRPTLRLGDLQWLLGCKWPVEIRRTNWSSIGFLWFCSIFIHSTYASMHQHCKTWRAFRSVSWLEAYPVW